MRRAVLRKPAPPQPPLEYDTSGYYYIDAMESSSFSPPFIVVCYVAYFCFMACIKYEVLDPLFHPETIVMAGGAATLLLAAYTAYVVLVGYWWQIIALLVLALVLVCAVVYLRGWDVLLFVGRHVLLSMAKGVDPPGRA